MSIALVIVRLEITDEADDVKDLSYSAPEFDFGWSNDPHKSYAEAAANKKTDFSEEKKQIHLGRRVYRSLTIESFYRQEVSEVDRRSMEKEATNKEKIGVKEDKNAKETVSDSKPREGPPSKGKSRQKGDHGEVKFAASNYSDEGISSRPGSGKGRGKSHSPTLQVPPSIRFFSGNPAVETTEGIIHLYKESQLTSLREDVPRSEMICILTVPAGMTSQDLLQFVGPVEPWIEVMKVIRDGTPNQYMVLIKFDKQKHADDFYKNFNNVPFNSIEPEVCHLVYVARVETVKCSEGGVFPVSGLTEMPVCPVCLERMDESVNGVLTILCNHSFHSSCLAQWGDTSSELKNYCPVCRYVQTPEPVADNKCSECSSQESLWICLICGYVGCGRYVERHAYRHYVETQHCYSMQLGNGRVWDYAGDNYVHRLVQNKGDGKIVAVDEGGNSMEEEKLDSITLEYTYLLTNQLDSQRRYFEEKIEMIEKNALAQVEEKEARCKKTLEEYAKLEQRISSINKEKQALEKKIAQLTSKNTKIANSLEEETQLNKCLQANQAELQKKLQQKEMEVKDLEEQLKDLMLNLDAQSKLASFSGTGVTQQEIQEGHISVGPAAGASASGGKKSKKRR